MPVPWIHTYVPDEHALDLRYSNIMAYFGSSLCLDVEGGLKDSSNSDDRPPLAINGGQHVVSKRLQIC